ncbi:unnamed protein product [Arabidopsis lyrata]|nr:unnamed protein product [Arabidopsis lyrata]
MDSDAGGGANRRRRDFASPIYLFWLLFMLSMLSASLLTLQTLSQPSQILFPSSFNGDQFSDGGRCWGPAFALPPHPLLAIDPSKPPYSGDVNLKAKSMAIAKLYTSKPRSDLIPPEEHSHRTSLMAGELPLGPSDAPCPLESSTAHGGSFFWVEKSWLSDRTLLGKMVSLLTYLIGLFRSALKTALSRSLFSYPVTASISDHTPLAMSSRDREQPLSPSKQRQAQGKTLIVKMGLFFVIGLPSSGPLSYLLRPKSICTFPSLHLLDPERTIARPSTSLRRNRVGFLIFFLEATCIESISPKVKEFLSTSLALYGNVTIQQCPEILVELSSTHHYIVCGKLLYCSCLRCLDLSSNYSIYVIYQSLLRVLVAIFVVSNDEVDVYLTFVLAMA